MDQLWAPWRMQYVTRADEQQGCVFCTCAGADDDANHGVLARGRHTFLILNAFPYSSGHLMIVPYEHQSDFTCLPADTVIEMMLLAQAAVGVLREELRAEGANVGLNIGKVAGAGIKDHIHMHVVPRWGGDTNFMTTLAETRVVPQCLEETWAALAPPLQRAVAAALGD